MTNQIITFGCRLNIYESEAIKATLEKSKQENLIVINSCTVTSEAERKLRQAIRKASKENPNHKIVLTGCAAQVNPEKYAQMKEVNFVLGNQEKFNAESYLFSDSKFSENKKNSLPKNINSDLQILHQDKIYYQQKNMFSDSISEDKILVNDIMSVSETASHMVSAFENKSRAYVQVQNGCNHRCSFCIIPYARGNSRSVALGEIVTQIKKLVDQGYKEVVLTGVDITDYGSGMAGEITFSKMIKRILKLVPELPRLRISSVDVAEIDNDFLDIIANESRFMPYLHISLQAGDDMILKRMKRRHTRKQVIDFCDKVRGLRDHVTFGSDIIAGFPTETEEMFQNTLNLISEAGIIFNHIFPYSKRDGTPAARMKEVPGPIKKERAKKLRDATEIELNKFLDRQIGSKQKIILEENNIGRCENFVTVQIENSNINLKTGDIFEVNIKSQNGNKLIAEISS